MGPTRRLEDEDGLRLDFQKPLPEPGSAVGMLAN
jgi:hypothetical protein